MRPVEQRPARSALSRRRFVGTAGAGAALAGLGLGIGRGQAQALRPLSFQLSWVKSIQYGGYFAGLDQGFFHPAGIDPTFSSAGPNTVGVAHVAPPRPPNGHPPITPL